MLQEDQIHEALRWIERQTHLKTKHARMLSSGDQGRLLQLISLMIQPKYILELGTFTGYSAVCLSRGLQAGGRLDALEINDELEDLILEGFRRAGLREPGEEKARLLIGDACALIPTLGDQTYDLVYIDANKRDYPRYLDLVLPRIRPDGYILADNVLWDGKVLLDNPPQDAQTQAILQFNQRVANDPRFESVLLPIRDGLYLIRVKKNIVPL